MAPGSGILSVFSFYGGASPGSIAVSMHSDVLEAITNSPVVDGTTQYVCTGAAVSGNAYTFVSPTNVIVTLTNNATLTWAWGTNYWLDVATNGNGNVSPAGAWCPRGSNAQIVATAGDHALFGSWSGQTNGCAIRTNAITAPMTAPRAITANFLPAILVTATANPASAGSVTGTGWYVSGSNAVTLVARTNAGWRFAGWSDGATSATHVVFHNLASDTNVTATFIELGAVATRASPTSGGSVTGAGVYDAGSNITLVARPSASWLFSNWEDSSTNASRWFTVPGGSVTCTATFVQGRILTLAASPAGGGSVAGGGTFLTNTVVTLTASPSNNWRFVKWNDNNTNAVRTVLVSAAATYTATFVQQGTLVVLAVPAEGGSTTGSGVYDVGSHPTLRAAASSGWRFGKWNDGNATTSRTVTVAAGTHTNSATFIQQTVITAVASPADGGSVSGSGTYDTNAVVTLTATAKAHWGFQQWEDTQSTTASRSLHAPAGNATYTGVFTMLTGEIALSTNALDFGWIPVGQSATQTVVVTNFGPSAIQVTSITVPTGYSATPAAFTLASNGMTHVTIVFKPTQVAAQTGTVALVSNAARGAGKVSVSGTGIPATRIVQLTGPLNFSDVLVGATNSLPLTITDAGNTPVTVTALAFSGAGSSAFKLPGVKVPFTVAAGGATNLTVTYAPIALGTNRATLTATVTSMTAAGSTNTLAASGSGVFARPTVAAQSGSVQVGPGNIPDGFSRWIAEHGLTGSPAERFSQVVDANGVTYGEQYAFGANLASGEPVMRVLTRNGVSTAEVPVQDPATWVDVTVTVEFTPQAGSGFWFPTVCLPPLSATSITKHWFQSEVGDAAGFKVTVRLVK